MQIPNTNQMLTNFYLSMHYSQ